VKPRATRGRVPHDEPRHKLAYDIGTIDRSLPFSVLKAKSQITERVKAANDDPRFSVRIREGLPRMSLALGSAGVTR
jgi:hypothetical protein